MWGNQEEASSLGRRATAHSAGPARHTDHTKSLVVTLYPAGAVELALHADRLGIPRYSWPREWTGLYESNRQSM